jgi:hypothetical protein
MFKEVTLVCSEDHVKHVNTLSEALNVTIYNTYIEQCAIWIINFEIIVDFISDYLGESLSVKPANQGLSSTVLIATNYIFSLTGVYTKCIFVFSCKLPGKATGKFH